MHASELDPYIGYMYGLCMPLNAPCAHVFQYQTAIYRHFGYVLQLTTTDIRALHRAYAAAERNDEGATVMWSTAEEKYFCGKYVGHKVIRGGYCTGYNRYRYRY